MKNEPLRWRKSSVSGEQTDCVELATVEDAVLVRDSKNPSGPVLRASDRSAFLQQITNGRA